MPVSDETPKKPVGLGDAVASVAEPIAKALDATLGTKIQGCAGCSGRRVILNRIMPDIKKPLKH